MTIGVGGAEDGEHRHVGPAHRRRTDDACPGVLRLHTAADGPLARIRLPGGVLRPDQLDALATAAETNGDGSIEITSRGNVQLRGVRDADALAAVLADADLLPAPRHDRVRNILASPHSGRIGGHTDVRALVDDLHTALTGRDSTAELPGRVLFALDDGSGDLSHRRADFGAHFVDADRAAILIDGADTGVRVRRDRVADVLVDLAETFARIRGDAWRVRDLPDGGAGLAAAAGLTPDPDAAPPVNLPGAPTSIGWFDQDDGAVTLAAATPLGVLPARTAHFLAAIDRPIVLTPDRFILVTDLDEGTAETVVRVLAPMGLIFDAASPWAEVTSCTGAPGCEHARADVRGDLIDAVREDALPTAGKQHWVGCERACGTPQGADIVVATDDGYRVADG